MAFRPFLKSHLLRQALYSSRAALMASKASLASSSSAFAGTVLKFFLVKLKHLW